MTAADLRAGQRVYLVSAPEVVGVIAPDDVPWTHGLTREDAIRRPHVRPSKVPVRWPSHDWWEDPESLRRASRGNNGLAANMRRARRTGQRQSALALQALAVLAANGTYPHWVAVLQHRVDNPTASLRELAQTMAPPMTKHAYAAQLRRALHAANHSLEVRR
jgi:hypothetical protein